MFKDVVLDEFSALRDVHLVSGDSMLWCVDGRKDMCCRLFEKERNTLAEQLSYHFIVDSLIDYCIHAPVRLIQHELLASGNIPSVPNINRVNAFQSDAICVICLCSKPQLRPKAPLTSMLNYQIRIVKSKEGRVFTSATQDVFEHIHIHATHR